MSSTRGLDRRPDQNDGQHTSPTVEEPTTTTATITEDQARPGRPLTAASPLHKLLAIVVLVAALVTVGAGTVDAATWTRGGSYGGVQLYPTIGQYVGSTSGLRIQGPYVTRSNASAGTQWVYHQVTVEQWLGDRWVYVWDSGLQGRAVTGSGRFLDTKFAGVGRGYFRVKHFIYWRDAHNRSLGYFAADFNHSSDYKCSIAACQVGNGWVRLT